MFGKVGVSFFNTDFFFLRRLSAVCPICGGV